MKNQMVGIVALIGVLALGGWNYFHRPPKIGYVEIQILMDEFTESIQAKKQFDVAQKEWDKNLKTLNDTLLGAMNQMKLNYEQAKPDIKKELRDKLDKSNADYQRYIEAVKKMSQDKEHELMDPVIKKTNSFLDLWGKSHGYDMIFGTTNVGNIVQANSNLNLTALVLNDLNEHYKNLPTAVSDKKDEVTGKGPNAAEVKK